MAEQQIIIPDIGGATNVDVIEINVKPGDVIGVDDALLTLESDKASMEVPSPLAGKITQIKVKVGDKVSQGDLIMMIEAEQTASQADNQPQQASPTQNSNAAHNDARANSAAAETITITVPDIGNASNVDVIEVNVQEGDEIAIDDSLITLESDKASMEVPSTAAGKVTKILVKVGDKVSQGDPILTMQATASAGLSTSKDTSKQDTQPAQIEPTKAPEKIISSSLKVATTTQAPATTNVNQAVANQTQAIQPSKPVHAGPGVRRLARELGVDLARVTSTGPKGRILQEDVHAFVKSVMTSSTGISGTGLTIAPAPAIDFSQFGETEIKALNKIKRLTGTNLHRNWVTIPHVTQFDEADITEMEAFRQSQKDQAAAQGAKLTPLVFLMKAVVACLRDLPQFNASLDASGENLIMKKYFNIGVAVDTPNGLVVPVIRNVDQKGMFTLAKELAAISHKAREKGLMPADMQGSCFTISSLGGIGGTAFTPIVNAPDVAILGVSRSQMKPIYNAATGNFEPRLMLPLSLSYDHRVIDGADGARFTALLVKYLSDIRTLLL
ncbi:MAG: dihydrolipoyllysine-residue acetyltransferase [Gammaproteobacteria bacterium]